LLEKSLVKVGGKRMLRELSLSSDEEDYEGLSPEEIAEKRALKSAKRKQELVDFASSEEDGKT
jgi:hypothetical protein